ncbi:MAG: GNAT family N-acetyltransferase [Chloroflexi bacterium]|nr:GNAT family N-acetyltransferase [Chloroflexota bacterium]
MCWWIRPYRPSDRQAVWTLVADTAFFGAPVEAFLEDRTLYCAAFAAYYTDYEPDRLWVAEVDRTVVGYVMGCGDSRRRVRTWGTRILPTILGAGLQRRYRIGRKTLRCAWRLLQAVLGRQIPAVPFDQFPGHLHIGVAAAARGQGVGRALLETSLAQFWATGVSGVHLMTTDRNRAACHLYESLGFQLLDTRQAGFWRGLIAGGVQNRAYGIRADWWVGGNGDGDTAFLPALRG